MKPLTLIWGKNGSGKTVNLVFDIDDNLMLEIYNNWIVASKQRQGKKFHYGHKGCWSSLGYWRHTIDLQGRKSINFSQASHTTVCEG